METIQVWDKMNEFDAPAVYQNRRYLFYTVYDETDEDGLSFNIQDSIEVVENRDNPQEPKWKDLGIVVESPLERLDKAMTMDPSILEDEENLYLVFGSHAGRIYLTDLNPSTLKLKMHPKQTKTSEYEERFVHLSQHMSPEGEEAEIERPSSSKNPILLSLRQLGRMLQRYRIDLQFENETF